MLVPQPSQLPRDFILQAQLLLQLAGLLDAARCARPASARRPAQAGPSMSAPPLDPGGGPRKPPSPRPTAPPASRVVTTLLLATSLAAAAAAPAPGGQARKEATGSWGSAHMPPPANAFVDWTPQWSSYDAAALDVPAPPPPRAASTQRYLLLGFPLGPSHAFVLGRVGGELAKRGGSVLAVAPPLAAPHLPYQSELLMDTGHGKRCTWLDLRDPADLATTRDLLRSADVFTQGYRPGTIAARGLAPEQVAALRPGIVCVSVCAYGHEGPWSDRRGFDSIVQNVTGLTSVQGSPAQPRNLPVQALDYIGGYLAALGAMAGLARRAEQGGSWLARVSLVQVAHWIAGLGMIDGSTGAAELPDAELAGLLMESDGPFGRLRHLKPVVGLSETPCFYARPAEPLGSSPARWA